LTRRVEVEVEAEVEAEVEVKELRGLKGLRFEV